VMTDCQFLLEPGLPHYTLDLRGPPRRSDQISPHTTATVASGAVWPLLMLTTPHGVQDAKTDIHMLRGEFPCDAELANQISGLLKS
jgi:hypothetical protein